MIGQFERTDLFQPVLDSNPASLSRIGFMLEKQFHELEFIFTEKISNISISGDFIFVVS